MNGDAHCVTRASLPHPKPVPKAGLAARPTNSDGCVQRTAYSTLSGQPYTATRGAPEAKQHDTAGRLGETNMKATRDFRHHLCNLRPSGCPREGDAPHLFYCKTVSTTRPSGN